MGVVSSVSVPQLCELHRKIAANQVDGATLQRFLDNPDRYNDALGRFGKIHHITVNRDLGLERLVKDANQNGGVNSDITPANFPIEGKGLRDVALELYEFDRTVGCEEAATLIEEEGEYQLEDLAEGLTFAKLNPLEQLRRPIAILGRKSRWQGRGYVYFPYLGWDDVGRCLSLSGLGVDLYPCWRVLVSRK